MTSRSLRCRLGLHSFRRDLRDAEGRFYCRRCGDQGRDAHFDPEWMPPGAGGTAP